MDRASPLDLAERDLGSTEAHQSGDELPKCGDDGSSTHEGKETSTAQRLVAQRAVEVQSVPAARPNAQKGYVR